METTHILYFQVKISFNDSATMTYEYPSEQSLLEQMAPEPGDFDYPIYSGNRGGVGGRESDDRELEDITQPSSGLMSTPGVGSGGMYRSNL